MSDHFVAKAARLASKTFLTEMDLLRIQQYLLAARMSADSTVLVDKQPPGYSSKLQHLEEFLPELFAEPGRKAVLFSEWTSMLNLIEPILNKNRIQFVRLDGKVPQKKRQQLVHQFQHDPECRLFLSTNAGSTGLNLQAANTVINIDLPWNPAVLEQRIARAHRMGQKKPVDVFVLVTESTIEERMLETLANKQSLYLAVLDPEASVRNIDFVSGMEAMKRRLEELMGRRIEAPVDQSSQHDAQRAVETYGPNREDRVAAAGGQLLTAAFGFLGELLPHAAEPPRAEVVQEMKARLESCVQTDAKGRTQLTLNFPNDEVVGKLAETLARLISLVPPPENH